MGVINTANMLRKAQQARSQMKKTGAAGVSKNDKLAVYIDGLNNLTEAELKEEFFEDEKFDCLSDNVKKDLKSDIEDMIVQAHKQARKELEKVLASSFDLESLSDMFGSN